MRNRYRRFGLDVVLDVPMGLVVPAPARAIAVGWTETDGGRDVTDVDLIAALVTMKLAGYGILVRVRAGAIEPSTS